MPQAVLLNSIGKQFAHHSALLMDCIITYNRRIVNLIRLTFLGYSMYNRVNSIGLGGQHDNWRGSPYAHIGAVQGESDHGKWVSSKVWHYAIHTE